MKIKFFQDNNSNAKTGENVEEDFFENGMMTMDTRIFKCQYFPLNLNTSIYFDDDQIL